MPWKETCKMDQRIEFAMKAIHTPNFSELCREYGISRKTGTKWRDRFIAHGSEGMEEHSRRPHGHPNELSEAKVCEIVRLKQAHPAWGPRKIRELYRRKHPADCPSESSFKRVLERAGLTQPRKRRRVGKSGRLATGRKAEAPNDVWTVDFKGWWFGGRDRQRVEPLTVRDEHSCMILELRALDNARTDTVRHCFENLFQRHGLPGAIRSDNGPPFASVHGLHGLSRLSAWWLALGIDLERGRPGCPQDNGAHERMHLDISHELQSKRIGRDQDAFDQWRYEFNHLRPHETLGMAMPAEKYTPSERPYQGTPDELDYGGLETRKVNHRLGTIVYRKQRIPITSSIGGWTVGLGGYEQTRQEVWFANLLLGHLDTETFAFIPTEPGRKTTASGHSSDSATLRRTNAREAYLKPQPKDKTCNH